MKRLLLTSVLFITINLISCKTNSISGVYVCDQSNKKQDTTIHHDTYDESTIDLTCVISAFDFKGNSTVSIKLKGAEMFSSYVIDKEYIRIKGDKSDILLRIKDANTLVEEGIFHGIYHKK